MQHRTICRIAAAAAAVWPLPYAHAETESVAFLADLPVVLTASRLTQSPLDAPAPVTVIDRAMIEASGFTEVHDLLRLVPGFVVADWPGGSPTVANHGLGDAHGRRIKVLIDGRTVNSPFWGDVNWHELPIRVDDIDQIEVVRGPHGAAYGANAFQGVVHIRTRPAEADDGHGVTIRGGRSNYRDVGVRINAPTNGVIDWRLSASKRRADTFRPHKDGSAETIDRDTANLQSVAHPTTSDELRLQIGATRGKDRRGYADDAVEPRHDERMREHYLHLAWLHLFAPETELSVQYYHQSRTHRAGWLAAAAGLQIPVELDNDTARDDIELQLSHRFDPHWQLLWGTGVREEGVRSEHYFATDNSIRRTQWQTFGSINWQPVDSFQLNLGATFEDHDYSGELFSPRIALNYFLSPLASLRLSTGIAHRAPSFMESASLETVRVDGEIVRAFYHAALPVRPEKVRYVELGYVARLPSLALDLDARIFHERYSDYLDDQSCRHSPGNRRACPFPAPAGFSSTPLSTTTFYFLNSGEFSMQGFEASANWERPGWGRVVLSQAFIDIRERASVPDDSLVLSAPSSLSSALLIKELPWRTKLSIGYYHNHPMYWLNDGDRVPSRDRIDVRVARAFGPAGSANEVALVFQNSGGAYPEFHEGRFRHEPRVYGSVTMAW